MGKANLAQKAITNLIKLPFFPFSHSFLDQ